MAFKEVAKADLERPSVVLSIPKARAIIGADESRKEGVREDEVIQVPYPGDTLPVNAAQAKWFLENIAYLVNVKKYKFHGTVGMNKSLLQSALETAHGKGEALPKDEAEPKQESGKKEPKS